MKVVHVFTSAACNYIPKVRVLVESIRKWHPEWRIHLALSDELPEGVDLSGEQFDEVHPASSLNIPDFNGWAFCHTIVEFSTAIKPYLLKKLLARDDCAGVVYLDPDTVVFSRLDDMLAGLESSNIALTPHQTIPETGLSAVIDNEICSLKHGIYNLGFIAVRPTDVGKEFANWWAERVYYFCRADISNGLFTDQRWIDLVPAFFDGVCVLRTSRLNVSTWNLTTREISGIAPFNVKVDNELLGFYHFSGFDSGAIHLMAEKNGSGNKTVNALISWYKNRIVSESVDPLSAVPWYYGHFYDGGQIDPASRLVYRQRLDLQHAFPNPFSTADGGYRLWWENTGPIEYKNLFESNKRAAEIDKIRTVLTPGFQAGGIGGERINMSLIASHLTKALTNDSHRKQVTRRAWEILRTEGVPGIKRRLRKY